MPKINFQIDLFKIGIERGKAVRTKTKIKKKAPHENQHESFKTVIKTSVASGLQNKFATLEQAADTFS